MSSPFPGMDPFLEHPSHFPGLHDRLINAISDALQTKLPEPYYAEIGERLWVEIAERLIELMCTSCGRTGLPKSADLHLPRKPGRRRLS